MFTNENKPLLLLEAAACNFCAETEGTTLYRVRDHLYGVDEREFALVRCATCALVYLTPRPVRADLARAYPAHYFWNAFDLKRGNSPLDGAWNLWARQLIRRRIRFLQKALGRGYPMGVPVLDVGCGRGLFLRELRQATGLACHGVDLQADNVAFLQAEHPEIRAFHADFLDFEGQEASYGAVSMWHLLEHLHDPAIALRKARALLRPGGVLVIGTQNFDGLSRLIQRDRWTLNDVPRHLYHFNEETLCRHVDAGGFKVMRVQHLTEFFPILGAHLFAEHVLDEQGAVRPLRGLALNLAFSPIELVASLTKRGCVMTLAARKA